MNRRKLFINYTGISQNRKVITQRNFYTFLLEDVGDLGSSLEMKCSGGEGGRTLRRIGASL